MKTVKIENLIEGLREFPAEFKCDNVYQFLAENPVDVETISPFFFWSEKFYTRNLIYKNERFELMVLCWDRGQVSKIHNHSDQMCWMTVPVGKLRGQNFRAVELDKEKGFCKLTETDRFDLSDCLAAKSNSNSRFIKFSICPNSTNAPSVFISTQNLSTNASVTAAKPIHLKKVNLCYASIRGELCEGIEL